MKASLADYGRACVFSMLGIHFRLILEATLDDTNWDITAVTIVTYMLINYFLV